MNMEILEKILRVLSPFVQDGLEMLVLLAVPIIAAYVRLWLIAVRKEAEQRLSEAQMDMAYEVVLRLAQAAEQLYKGRGRGPEKKEWLMDRVEQELAQVGLVLDLDQIETILEAAIRREIYWTPKPAS